MVDFDPDTMPHRPPMRLVDSLLEVGEDDGIASFHIRPGNLFLDENRVLLRETLLEIMAQAYMAVSVWRAAKNGVSIPGGYLVGLRNLRIDGDAREGDTLVTKVRASDAVAQVALVEGEVFRDGTLLARGELRLYTLPAEGAA